ncbi:MAG: ABC transporter substrate-binding protein [Deltaproteobacteria bacterium]|nr:ABC transporter substrate-binding protein [Deltaproteobacteria bacterium]
MRKLAFIALLALAGCPKHEEAPDAGAIAPGAPVPTTEQEPNDEAAHAQQLKGPVDVTASLSAAAGKKADEDWYALDPALGRVTVKVDPAPPLDVIVEIYDSDGVKRLTQDGAAGGGSEVIHGLVVARAPKLRVLGKKDALGPYHLTVVADAPDAATEQEPNNRAADATPLEADKPLTGYISDSTDEDWFQISLPGPDGGEDAGPLDAGPVDAGAAPTIDAGTAELDAGVIDAGATDAGAAADAGQVVDAGSTPPPPPPPPMLLHLTISGVPGVRLEVDVVNAAGAPLLSAKGKSPGDGVEIRNVALRAPERDFYVVVKSAWVGEKKEAKRSASVDSPYTITAHLEQAQGEVELEPNDDAAHATSMAWEGNTASIVGYLSPRADVDDYVLHSDKPVIARAEVSGVEHLDLELSVLGVPDGGKETTLLTANDGELKEPEVLTNLAFGPGDLYLQVRGAARKGPDGKWTRDSENAKDPYRLTVTAAPDDGTKEHEPNNTPETATPLAPNQTLRGTIHPKKDVDFYRLDLTSLPVKTTIKASVTGILKVDVALYLYRQKEDGTLAIVQTSDSAKGDAPESITYAAEPGLYFLKVKDTKDRESNFVDSYAIRVELQ